MDEPVFNRTSLPGNPAKWPRYRKLSLTHALRIRGPFRVETSEGVMRCEDGYLALDVSGSPYPVAWDVFQKTYTKEQ